MRKANEMPPGIRFTPSLAQFEIARAVAREKEARDHAAERDADHALLDAALDEIAPDEKQSADDSG